MRLFGKAALATIVLTLAPGCEPTCNQTCEKLLECDDVSTPRLSEDDCTNSCEVQQQLYEDWDDTQLQAAFVDYKECVDTNECGAIADGACYDDDLYAW